MTELESQLAIGHTQPAAVAAELTSADLDPARSQENLLSIHADLDAPRESRLARLLRRLGISDLTVPLVTATPALRRSWFGAVAIAVLFAVSTASGSSGAGADRILVFLTLAPLVPLLGVALAFGKAIDATHDLVVAAPRDTFDVFLIRAVTVLVTSATVLLFSSALLPEGGLFRLAWLLPSIATTMLSLALSSRFAPRSVTLTVGAGWLVAVIVASRATCAAATFGLVMQCLAAGVSVVSIGLFTRQQERFEVGR